VKSGGPEVRRLADDGGWRVTEKSAAWIAREEAAMRTLYVGSTEAYAGKTMFTLSLGLHLKNMGKRVGYIKPLGLLATREQGAVADEDAAYVREILGLDDSMEDVSPVVMTPEALEQAMKGKAPDYAGRVRAAFDRVSSGKDVTLAGGGGTVLATGAVLGLAARQIAEILDAKVLLISKYNPDRGMDLILAARELLGERLMGVVVNPVPPGQGERLRQLWEPYLRERGLSLFGLVPRDIVLYAVSVGELAEHLGAEFVYGSHKLEDLVEQFSVGAMHVEAALAHFRRIPNKAVVTGGDRADIQLAALETSTRCLVLTGGLRPNSVILGRAEEKQVPVLLVRDDTLRTVERIEHLLGRVRVRGSHKIARAVELVAKHLDLDALWRELES
jgi:hypothetical protein